MTKKIETELEVLRASLELYAQHEAPSPWEVLEMQIRATCARLGLPKPDMAHFPQGDLASHYMSSLDE